MVLADGHHAAGLMGKSLARDARGSDRGPRFAKASRGRRLRSPNQFGRREEAFGGTPNEATETVALPMFVRQTSGHFSRPEGKV